MTCKWKRGWRECEGQAQRSLSETSSSCMYYISQLSHCQLKPCQVSHPPYNPPLGRLFPGKDDCETKKAAHIRIATRILLTGSQILCFSEEGTMIDWGLSSEEAAMSGVQQRLKLKQTPIDTWSLKEHLTLASAVLKWVSLHTMWITQKKSNK